MGIAVTDEMQIIASGLATVASGDAIAFLQNYFSTEKVAKVIIGEPKQMDGTPSESAPAVKIFVQKFKAAFPNVEILGVDERFTSKIAFRSMVDSGLGKKKRQDKGLIDEISATIMLQDYLSRKMI